MEHISQIFFFRSLFADLYVSFTFLEIAGDLTFLIQQKTCFYHLSFIYSWSFDNTQNLCPTFSYIILIIHIWTLLILSDLIMYSFPQKIMQNPSFLWGDEWGVTLPHITFHPIFYRILYHIISYFILSYGMLSYILSFIFYLNMQTPSYLWGGEVAQARITRLHALNRGLIFQHYHYHQLIINQYYH